MRIAIVTDAWYPQVNGVVRTLNKTGQILASMGHAVTYLTPEGLASVPCPTYRSIRLALRPGPLLRRRLDALAPHAIHIATEGPLGLAARAYCRQRDLRFTTSYHTQFPQYVRLRAPVPLAVTYAYLRWFHGAAARTLVATPGMRTELQQRGFRELGLWPRGVDADLFRPRSKDYLLDSRPLAMYVGRVAVEKNIEEFLRMPWPGSKYVVGDGPDTAMLRAAFPAVRFLGFKHGEDLAACVAAADVMVFPSRTDTFGLVMLESMACGVPVAAYPVTGPIDVVRQGVTGMLDDDLARAACAALALDWKACRAYALAHSWEAATRQFLGQLVRNPRPDGYQGRG